jgi:hypothetical protein
MPAHQNCDFETLSDSQLALRPKDPTAPHHDLLGGCPPAKAASLGEERLPGLMVQDSDWAEWEAVHAELWR